MTMLIRYPYPWHEGRSAYDVTGPDAPVTVEHCGATLRVAPVLQLARTIYKVECLTCGEVVIAGTHAPRAWCDLHLNEKHAL